MRVSVTELTPKLMLLLHDSAQTVDFPVAVAAASGVNCSLSCSRSEHVGL